MRRIHVTGESFPRGAVKPPPTRLREFEACSAAYAGFSNRWTYTSGVVGRRNRDWFGSFQTSHLRTHGNRCAAACAKSLVKLAEVGAKFGGRPPFAQRGAPLI